MTPTAPITVLVPSRGRPGNIEQLIDAWVSTAAGGYAELVVIVDDDDPHVAAYQAVDYPAEFAELVIGPRLRLGGTLNHYAPAAAYRSLAVGFLGDDHRPRSMRWDQTIYETVAAGRHVVAYGNDLIQGPALPTAVFLSSSIINTVGYFVPPGMTHLFLDNYWRRLGETLGSLRYLPDVIIEHVHPIAGRAAWDDGYTEVNAPAVWTADETRFSQYVADGEFAAAITRLSTTEVY